MKILNLMLKVNYFKMIKTQLNQLQNKNWIQNACQCPIAFAQVREDSLIDNEIINSINNDNIQALMVASGGCTAAFLATNRKIVKLDIVDANPAQIALTKLKLLLLQEKTPIERLALLGHRDMQEEDRGRETIDYLNKLGYPSHILGDLTMLKQRGLDYIGRYEFLFSALQDALCPFKDYILELLDNSNEERFSPDKNLLAHLKSVFQKIMSLENLIALFGNDATQNPLIPFWEHFFNQTLLALQHLSLNNPYLSQMLLGAFYNNVTYPWLSLPKQKLDLRINYLSENMASALRLTNHKYNFIHLSNILDWVTTREATKILDLAVQKLTDDGLIIIRKLNSSLNIHSLHNKIQWHSEKENLLLQSDRSFFYKALYLGSK